MTTRYYDLLDVHVEVDSDGLRSKLEEIQGTLENHSTRLEGLGDNEWSEGTINDLIEQKLSNDGYVTDDDVKQTVRDELDGYITGEDVDAKLEEHTHEDMDEERVQEIFRDMAHNEGEAMVESLIDDRGYLTSDDVDTKLEDYVTGDDLSGKVDEAIESTGLEARVDTLEQRADDEKSIESLAERVAALEAELAKTDGAVDIRFTNLHDRVAALEARDDTAMDFFKLIKQAFALLKQ